MTTHHAGLTEMTTDVIYPHDWRPTAVRWSWKPFVWTWSEIMHLVSAVLGIVGNLLVIVALYKRRAATRSTDRLIGALALADFLTSIFVIPHPVEETVPASPLGQLYCKMVLPGFFLFVCFTASIYILVAISVERYLAVVHPLLYIRLVTRKQILFIVIALIWISSTLVYTVFIGTVVIVDPNTNRCVLHFNHPSGKATFGAFALIYRLIFPTVVMMITQILIARNLHQRSVRYRGNTGVTYHMRARNRVLQLMLIVIIVYIICWGPGQIVFFLYSIDAIPSSFIGSPYHIFVIVLTAYNSSLNPIIYTAWFPEFRVALRQVFSCGIAGSTAPIFDEKKTSATYADKRETASNI